MINQTAFFCFLHLPETSPLKLTSETVHGDLAMHIMLNCLLIKYYINRLRNRRHPALEGYIMHCPPPVWHLRATTTGLSDYDGSITPLSPFGLVGRFTVSDINILSKYYVKYGCMICFRKKLLKTSTSGFLELKLLYSFCSSTLKNSSNSGIRKITSRSNPCDFISITS